MNTLTEKVIEFWDNLKDSYPESIKLEAADQLAGHFMGESAEIEFGLGYDPDADVLQLNEDDDLSGEFRTEEEDVEDSNDFDEEEEEE